ncbi:type II toxin-antitoxin system HicB family antitoxin [Dyella kyungheensis]|jgi:predicted RNase H-like HicB family nuclease|uniref:type II toxin-antitoxin system HicB family antitoxin n=1 Tax=Dyella kyungheensis TaxID=1242174 RepID=UPI003CF69228
MKYPVAIEAGSDTTAWGVVVPDLPGCYSAGDGLADACENAKQAIALWVNSAKEDGQPIPAPKPLSEHQANPEFAGWVWEMVELDPSI